MGNLVSEKDSCKEVKESDDSEMLRVHAENRCHKPLCLYISDYVISN